MGIVLLFVPERVWFAVVLLATAIGLHFAARVLISIHFSKLRRLLSRVSEYKDLFQQYPQAKVGEFSRKLLEEEW